MSRIVVFGLDNVAVGEFTANCDRGWVLLGNPGVADGAQTTVTVPDEVAEQPWLQLGRMVLVERPPLPSWAGVIDTPWKATLPVEITLYNAEYLFALRAAEISVSINGPISDVVKEMIRLANEQENLFVSLGTSRDVQTQYSKVIEQRNIWDQMIKILEESGQEMIFRHELNSQRQLNLIADVGPLMGANTGFLLRDRDESNVHANMTVIDAKVNGKVINRVMGVSGQTTQEDQLQTNVLEDQSSQDVFRTRSEIVQFRNVTELSTLTQYAKVYLDSYKRPFIDLTVDAMNVDDTFSHLRLGNRLLMRAVNVYLPGGIRGWSGTVRILAMAYDETQDTVRMTVRGVL